MNKICIVGGCGHIGIPLGLTLADKNFIVTLIDTNKYAVDMINSCKLPFLERGAQEILNKCIGKNLSATCDISEIKNHDVIIYTVGTPIDEHYNPKINDIIDIIKTHLQYINKNQLIILRSTIFPGTTEIINNMLIDAFGSSKLAFCPERIVQGDGIREISSLPQIISATTEMALQETKEIFSKISPKIIILKPKEAELAKLITNSWRYLEFAIANQFYTMAESAGIDFYKILNSIKDDYPRAKYFTTPGFSAGPCLLKDTMQLCAFYRGQFSLGQAAMQVNEGLPEFVVRQLENKMGSLKDKKIAILGMTFKANNDDIRESLSFKIKKILQFKMAKVIASDIYLKDTTDYNSAINEADGIILGVPHDEYKNLRTKKPFVDCWNLWKD